MKKVIKSLFTDKSFWTAIIALVSCICVACNVPQGSVTQITSFVSAIGTLIAYIISNGIQQAAIIKAQSQAEAMKYFLANGTANASDGLPHTRGGNEKEDRG